MPATAVPLPTTKEEMENYKPPCTKCSATCNAVNLGRNVWEIVCSNEKCKTKHRICQGYKKSTDRNAANEKCGRENPLTPYDQLYVEKSGTTTKHRNQCMACRKLYRDAAPAKNAAAALSSGKNETFNWDGYNSEDSDGSASSSTNTSGSSTPLRTGAGSPTRAGGVTRTVIAPVAREPPPPMTEVASMYENIGKLLEAANIKLVAAITQNDTNLARVEAKVISLESKVEACTAECKEYRELLLKQATVKKEEIDAIEKKYSDKAAEQKELQVKSETLLKNMVIAGQGIGNYVFTAEFDALVGEDATIDDKLKMLDFIIVHRLRAHKTRKDKKHPEKKQGWVIKAHAYNKDHISSEVLPTPAAAYKHGCEEIMKALKVLNPDVEPDTEE